MVRLFVSVLLGLFCIANQSFALSPAESLNQKLLQMQALTAKFEQVVSDAKGYRMQEVRGDMKVKRPKQFYWETLDPYPQLIVSDGDSVWIYDHDLEQVTIQKLDAQAGNTPAMLLSGDPQKITESFSVSSEKMPDGQSERFVLKPLTEGALFEVLTVTFRNNTISEMDLQDSLGQKTAITFKSISMNPEIDSSIFTFTPPEGVDIIRDF